MVEKHSPKLPLRNFRSFYICVPKCDQIDFFQATRILAQNVKKRHGKFLASQQSDRISYKQETLTLWQEN